MNTVQLVNGDFVIGKGGFAMVSGRDKVKQDLSLAVAEALGVDRFHPGWGSQLTDYVGSPQDEMTASSIKAEIGRVVQNYIAVQVQQMQADSLADRPTRFSADEVVRGISSIQVTPQWDSTYIKVVVTTLSGDQVTVVDSTLGTGT